MQNTNDRSIRASVAMAVYNAEKYICEQVDSVLALMSENDELVISYDNSADRTWDIINSYAKADCRVRVVKNSRKRGVRGNFTNAVEHCRGKYIFLSDQDDVWIHDKINKIADIFENTHALLVVHDAYESDSELNVTCGSVFEKYKISKSGFRNYVSSTASGCCMAFRAEIKDTLLPFPENNAHDVWTMMVCSALGKIFLLYEILIIHRMHGENVTVGRRALPVVMKDRASLAARYAARMIKYVFLKKRRQK